MSSKADENEPLESSEASARSVTVFAIVLSTAISNGVVERPDENEGEAMDGVVATEDVVECVDGVETVVNCLFLAVSRSPLLRNPSILIWTRCSVNQKSTQQSRIGKVWWRCLYIAVLAAKDCAGQTFGTVIAL